MNPTMIDATLIVPGNQPVDLAPVLDRLGQVPDAELAREIGCHPRTIARERRRREIERK